eukprot:6188315-Pleurochrysis_carterae.AAC.1
MSARKGQGGSRPGSAVAYMRYSFQFAARLRHTLASRFLIGKTVPARSTRDQWQNKQDCLLTQMNASMAAAAAKVVRLACPLIVYHEGFDMHRLACDNTKYAPACFAFDHLLQCPEL